MLVCLAIIDRNIVIFFDLLEADYFRAVDMDNFLEMRFSRNVSLIESIVF